MPFTDAEKAKLRYYCGYPNIGREFFSYNTYILSAWYQNFEAKIDNLIPEDETFVREILGTLDTLKESFINTYQNLDTAKAAVWQRNPKELKEKRDLYVYWRIELCKVFGVAYNPVSTPFGGGARPM